MVQDISPWLLFDFTDGWFGSDAYSEGANRYRIGGYCPVHLGDLFDNGTYTVVYKLGHGGSSTVWLARDNRHDPGSEDHPYRYVALKVISAAETNALQEEVSIMQYLRALPSSEVAKSEHQFDAEQFRGSIAHLIRNFSHESVNGIHTVLVLPVMRGLGELPRIGTNVPSYLHDVSRQLFGALAFLHQRGVVHGDLWYPNAGYLCSDITDSDIGQMFKPPICPIVLWRYNSEPPKAGTAFSKDFKGQLDMMRRGGEVVNPIPIEREGALPKYLVSSEGWLESRHLFQRYRVAPRVCLSDFGSSFRLDGSERPLLCIPGPYAAPEYSLPTHKLGSGLAVADDEAPQKQKQKRRHGDYSSVLGSVEEKADVWTLGCLLYQLFCGECLDDGIDFSGDATPDLIKIDPAVPEDWKALPGMKLALDTLGSKAEKASAKFWESVRSDICNMAQTRARVIYRDNHENGYGNMWFPFFKAKDYQELTQLLKSALRVDPRIRPSAISLYKQLEAQSAARLSTKSKPIEQFYGDAEFEG